MNKCGKILLLLAQSIFASGTVAVLEITPSGDDIELTVSEYRHLTDELRAQARSVLPKEYTILTRDNIISLIPPDEAEAECLAESCAVEIGRAIAAEYVMQGQVRKFGDMLTITVELYESMSGNMLGSFVAENQNSIGLLNSIREKAKPIFESLLPPAPVPEAGKQPDAPVKEEAPPPEARQAAPAFKAGLTAKIGFVKSGVKNGKSGTSYSAGLIMAKNLGFADFAPELLFSSDEFEINEMKISVLKADIPLLARVVFAKSVGVSLGAVLSLPFSSKIENEAPGDAQKFLIAAAGGLAYMITEGFFINASYEKYFTEIFKSVKNSNTDRALCGIGYLF